MAGHCRSVEIPGIQRGRHTCTSYFWLFADNHALQYSWVFMSSKLLGYLPNLAILKGVFSKHWVKNTESVADLVDGFGRWNQESRRRVGSRFSDR